VKAFRLVAVVAYVGYLVQIGLLMVMLPWSDAWSVLLLRLPASLAVWLDSPAVKGMVTAFGCLHLLLLALELRPTGSGDTIRSATVPKSPKSQNGSYY